MSGKIIDRGVDEILLAGGEMVRVDKLSTRQLIAVLKQHDLLKDVEYVSYDEYEHSNYPKPLI